MDAAIRQALVALVRDRGVAALGTVHAGAPLVSQVLYAPAPDLAELYVHVSRLAQHTAGLLADPRVGLLIAERDVPTRNPLSLARVSIQGVAESLEPASAAFSAARAAYLAAHPSAAINFQLADFLLFRIRPHAARFVAGFGKIVDLDRAAWLRLGGDAVGPSA
jgi:putative heme iron utilization protein